MQLFVLMDSDQHTRHKQQLSRAAHFCKYQTAKDLELEGFKEDIVVNEYTGQTEYTFKLYINGLTLVKENGPYFLTDSNEKVQVHGEY